VKAKERHKVKLLEFLGNPENEFYNRYNMAKKVLNFSKSVTLYRSFSPAELSEIEREALKIRRTKYSAEIAKVDKAILRRAQSGDVQAAKLCFQKFEGWSERRKVEHAGLLVDPNPPRALIYLPDNGR